MTPLENILENFPDRMYPNRKSDSQIFTPVNVAKEMIEALPLEVWNSSTTFLDICCKSGIFLYEIYLKLMSSELVKRDYPEENKRREHILTKQIFGISPDDPCKLFSTRTVYGSISSKSNIISFGNNYTKVMTNEDRRFLTDTLVKEFKTMKFDVVIGNPPYNRGVDIDFVFLGYELSKHLVSMITPAKWQTAEADQRIASKHSYGEFRREIVPHMSHVCFYPDCLDVFGIQESSGITYYVLDKNNNYNNRCEVINKCNLQPKIVSTLTRDISNRQSLWNIGHEIIEYMGDYNKYNIQKILNRKAYTININTQLTKSTGSSGVWDWENSKIKPECIGKGGVLLGKNGNLVLTGGPKLLQGDIKSSSSTSLDIFTSDTVEECKNFYSWFDTKFTRFFILINISSLTILNDNTFRFVPAPPSGKFDHIYTDEELYKAFNLPQKYIDVIEAVIKERK